MAVEALDRAVRLFGTPLYVYHEIVHNRQVVDQFRQRGVVFVDHLQEVPVGSLLDVQCPRSFAGGSRRGRAAGATRH